MAATRVSTPPAPEARNWAGDRHDTGVSDGGGRLLVPARGCYTQGGGGSGVKGRPEADRFSDA
jgi:hypothetical protein